MYFKKVLAFVFAILCLSSVAVSFADTPLWQAWLYDDSTGELILINSEQAVLETIILPNPQGYYLPYFVTVAPTGDRVAYVLRSSSDQLQLIVFNLLNRTIALDYTLSAPLAGSGALNGTSLDYGSRSEVFSADGRFLALSYYLDENWTLAIFDTETSQLIQTYTSIALNNPIAQNAYALPVPVLLDANLVYVVVAPIAGDGAFTLDSYVWNYVSNTLTSSNIFRTLDYDIDPRNGEVIYAYRSPLFIDRTDEIIGMGVHQNSVQVFSPSISATDTFAFYKDEISTIDYAHFIQNGERILLRTSDINGNSYGNYRVVNRAGVFQGILPYQGVWIYSVFSVREGVVFNISTTELAPYIPFVQGMNSTAVVYIDTVNFQIGANTGVVLHIGDSNTYPRLVWVQDAFPSSPPAPSWTQLTAPIVSNPPANTQPTPSGQSPSQIGNTPPITGQSPSQIGNLGGLSVGGQAIVTATGDGLNVRQTPSTSGTKITQLPPNTIVNIIGGPQSANGFMWWQINANGVIGWSAQGSSSEVWLQLYTGNGGGGGVAVPTPIPTVDGTAVLPPPTLHTPIPNQAFTLNDINPPGTGTIVPIALTWSTVPGASFYQVSIARCEVTCELFYVYLTDTPSHLFDVSQYGYGTYRWGVATLNQLEMTGLTSQYQFFTYTMN